MYSWEINETLRECNYNIDTETYLKILKTSPQINWVKFNAYENCFEMTDDENNRWKFSVYRKEN